MNQMFHMELRQESLVIVHEGINSIHSSFAVDWHNKKCTIAVVLTMITNKMTVREVAVILNTLVGFRLKAWTLS